MAVVYAPLHFDSLPRLYYRHQAVTILPNEFISSLPHPADCPSAGRVPVWGDAIGFPEVEAVGESGADLMVFTYHKAVFVPFRLDVVYPNWNGTSRSRTNAKIIPIAVIIIESLMVSRFKTTNPHIKTISSKIERILK